MALSTLRYRDWVFEVDKELTELTYEKILKSGADACSCIDCHNYTKYRENIFPYEIKQLLGELGINYRKEVEIYTIDENQDRLVCGWFHFKGRIVSGKDCNVSINKNSSNITLTRITDNFSIGFTKDNALSYFEDKEELVQIEFAANISWITGKLLGNS
jgi:hypothetical protein